ncbi:efflux RND transporter permease subunit [Actinoallomurus sp. NBC_01490]|uniref:efflux RND transporter permease subunit n=1 Tax=Actinoallomurus sp. NBC_01490 TaxID=2903557 RepID=UPI002E2FF2C8|nr:efflux RND transporter permease subunit [Actinoallomurus sp. NBC_01490]
MSWLSKISLAHRKLVLLITIGVIALGAYLIPMLKQQLLPSLSFPAIAVTATYPGASPQVVEDQVVKPIEDAVKGTDGLETMTSTSRQGSATVQLRFAFGTDTQDRSTRIQQDLNKISQRLPDDVDPQVMTGSTDDLPTLTLAATSRDDPRVLADKLTDQVVPELEAVDGVNEAAVSGERARVVRVVPDQAKLKRHGLTMAAVTTALQTAGITAPGGSVDANGKSVSVQIGGPITSVSQLEQLWLTPSAAASPSGGARSSAARGGVPGAAAAGAAGGAARLGQVASVQVTDAAATSLTRTDGRESLGVAITLDPEGSASSVSDDVRRLLPGLERELGDGARLTVVSDSGPAVSEAVSGLLEEGLLGLVMAIVVIVLFLRSARSTLVTAISIPLSVVIALIALKAGGYSLNMLTLGALTIAVGRVVDDSIVVLENIKRHLGYGEDKATAVRTAVREVAGAVTASTLTTIAVFLPIALVTGMVGQLFGPFSITVTVAMLASLVVALTVIPILAYWFLKTPATGADPEEFRRRVEEEERHGPLQRAYVPVISFATRHRKSVPAGAVVILIGTFALAGGLKTSFLGDSGTQALSITQKLPAGSSLAATDAAAKKVEGVLAATGGVASYQVTIGSPGGLMGAGRGANSASYTVSLKDGADADTVKNTLSGRLDGLAGAGELTVAADSGFGASNDIQVQVHGTDDTALTAATRQIEQALKGVSQVTDVTSDLSESAPQIVVHADGKKAVAAGLTDTTLAAAVTEATQGQTVTTVSLDGEDTDVVLRSTGDAPHNAADLKNLKIGTATGRTVRLGDVATVTQQNGPVERARVDGDRTITVTATPVGDDTGAANRAVTTALDKLRLPAGADYSLGGITSDQNEAFKQLGLAIVAAIVIVFLLLVATFGSIRQTLVLLVSIPFAATGALLLLRVTGVPLGVAAMVGLLMLIGIVVTNAIVLVDLINQYRKTGMSITEAVTEGGRRRLRPILMTALATVFALLPMALGVTDSGGFISQPLAVVVIGGLVSSTVLSLILIPTLYTMVETRRERRHARKNRLDQAPRHRTKEPALP